MPKMRIYKEFKFDAAHRLTQVDEGHKCGNLHGHTFVLEVHLEGEVDPSRGWILDFNVLCDAVNPIMDQLSTPFLTIWRESGTPPAKTSPFGFGKS